MYFKVKGSRGRERQNEYGNKNGLVKDNALNLAKYRQVMKIMDQ